MPKHSVDLGAVNGSHPPQLVRVTCAAPEVQISTPTSALVTYEPPLKRRRRLTSSIGTLNLPKFYSTAASAHIFSNSSPLAHSLLSILYDVADIFTAIQLRSVCKLYQTLYYSSRARRLSIEDIRIDPFQSNVALLSDWRVVVENDGKDERRPYLRPMFVSATHRELDIVLCPSSTLDIYFYGRIPCIQEEAWDPASYSLLDDKPSGYKLIQSNHVGSPLFGSVDKERWAISASSRGFTIRDLTRISTWRWIRYANARTSSKDIQNCTTAVYGRSMPLRYDKQLNGYVLDALQMPNFSY
jgi:hypothetical protein